MIVFMDALLLDVNAISLKNETKPPEVNVMALAHRVLLIQRYGMQRNVDE